MKIAAIEALEGKQVLIPQCMVAETPWERLVGLLGHSRLQAGEGLWIEPCASIHTFFMRFPIDAVFVAKNGLILAVKSRLTPWRLTRFYWRAKSVLELPSGDAERLGIRVGGYLKVREKH